MPVRPEEDKDLLTQVSADIQNVYDHWRAARRKTRSNYDRISPGRRAKLKSRLAEFTAAELCAAIDGVAKDPWADRALHDDITVIFRSREQVERFLEMGAAANGAARMDPVAKARLWVTQAGWRYPDADLIEELSRMGIEGDERRRMAELAMRIQAQHA